MNLDDPDEQITWLTKVLSSAVNENSMLSKEKTIKLYSAYADVESYCRCT